MSLLSSLFSTSLTPAWTADVRSALWRVMFSADGCIILEDRDTVNKTAVFSCVDALSGKVVWSERSMGEPWWIGLSAVTAQRVYLHGFRKPDMPEPWTITAADRSTGSVLWKNEQCAFHSASDSALFGYRDLFERRVYYRVDPATGTILEEFDALPADAPDAAGNERTDFTFPEAVLPSDPQILAVHPDARDAASAEQIICGRYDLLSMYHPVAGDVPTLKNRLTIVDTQTKKKVYSIVMNGETPYPVPDSFFVDKERVYYVHERRTLVAVDLPR